VVTPLLMVSGRIGEGQITGAADIEIIADRKNVRESVRRCIGVLKRAAGYDK
jgi:hypothetical protein